jgi:hypothetical protein
MTMLALAVALAQLVELSDVASCAALAITSPRDAWRLTVIPDGSARVNYAALPQTLQVPAGTFDFRQLHSSLAERARSTQTHADSGTVECRSVKREPQRALLYFDDERFAAQEFERAWKRAPEPSDSIEKEHVETLRGMWDRRARPR